MENKRIISAAGRWKSTSTLTGRGCTCLGNKGAPIEPFGPLAAYDLTEVEGTDSLS